MTSIRKRLVSVFSCITLILFIVSSVQASSSSSFLRANQLYSVCSSDTKSDNAFCEGYIAGVNDSLYSGHLGNIFQVCYPAGVTIQQLRLILIKYFETIPDKLHYVADGIAAEALANTFQCQANESN